MTWAWEISYINKNNGRVYEFHGYKSFRQFQFIYLNRERVNRLEQQASFFKIIEERLEERYSLQKGSLQGLHLIYGSEVAMEKAMQNVETRELLTDQRNIVVINFYHGTRTMRRYIYSLQTEERINIDPELNGHESYLAQQG